jgi:dihydrolipoamide dehydrogenase
MSTPGETIYDVAVLGGGPGGYVAASRAAQLGLKTTVIERDELGGICVNWGCIPSKALLRSAEVLSLFQRAGDFGIAVEGVTANYGAALARCRQIVATQVRGVHYLMRKNGIEVVRGEGRLLARGRIALAGGPDGERTVQARNVILATGSRVRPLPGVELDGEHIISAKEAWNLEPLPRSVLIVGAGAIGVEFATVYSAYGCEVTLVEYLPRLLPLEDEEMGAELARSFRRRGITMLTTTKVDGATLSSDRVRVQVAPVSAAGAEVPQTLDVDRVLVGAGFLPNSEGLGLEALGVATERGFIAVDERMQTSVPGIYAVGDVTGKLPLAHVGFAQGELAAEVIAGRDPQPLDYQAVPRCVYSSPQVAALGLTEAQARADGREVRVGSFPFRPNGKAQALGELEGKAKIVADAATGEILGAHLVGPDVTELIGEVALARVLEATPFELAQAVHPHPTLSEVLDEAALAVEGRALHL